MGFIRYAVFCPVGFIRLLLLTGGIYSFAAFIRRDLSVPALFVRWNLSVPPFYSGGTVFPGFPEKLHGTYFKIQFGDNKCKLLIKLRLLEFDFRYKCINTRALSVKVHYKVYIP